MLRLFKYEFQRKGKTMLYTVLGYLLINYAFLLKFKSDGTYSIEEMPFQVVFFIILASGLFVAGLLGAVNNLRLEAKLSTRDLYFSLPLTAYTKIGSKVILSTVEIIGAGIIAITICMKSIESLTGFNILESFLNEMSQVGAEYLVPAIITVVLSIIISLLTVYLAFAIFRAFFSQAKFGGAITVGIFIGINYIITKFIVRGVEYGLTEGVFTSEAYFTENILPMLISFALTGVLFLLTSFLFEKRVSFD